MNRTALPSSPTPRSAFLLVACLLLALLSVAPPVRAQQASTGRNPRSQRDLASARSQGLLRSRHLGSPSLRASPSRGAQQSLAFYRSKIRPILAKTCFECHGEEEQEAELRLDRLDPDLVRGPDAQRWLEVQSVLSNH